jgi:CarD family transcriptional regulator
MQFSVGDKVVHPGIGAGRIIDTQTQELVEGPQTYYVIEIPGRESTVYIPMRKMEEVGVRPVASSDRVSYVFDTLAGKPKPLPKAYKKRQEQIEEKIQTGRLSQIAEAIRDLSWHEHVEHLTKRDTDLLTRGRKFLAGEISVALDSEVEEIQEKIDQLLSATVAEATEQEEKQ